MTALATCPGTSSQGDVKLDWSYIHAQLVPLLELKEAPELLTELETMRENIRRQRQRLS